MIDLPDVNLWLALVDQRHVHHQRARAYWSQQSAGRIAFCRITMLGFLRLCTNPKAMANPKTNAAAWAIYQQFTALPIVQFLADPPGMDVHFQAVTTQSAFPHRLWTDAYLAAFAVADGSRLVSFDAEFTRFPGLHFLHLMP
ncbi:MAG: TA system VapC family ribonuclease toxin [Verrucomicrobiales bacterium]